MTHQMTPEQEEQVRRALAAAARAEDGSAPPTMPESVAARLDGVLAELVAGRGTPTGTDDRDELARRRSRRRLNALVAAAAVAVIATAGGAVVKGGLGGSSGSADSSASSDSGAGGQAHDQAGPQPEAAVPSGPSLAGVPSAAGSGRASARPLAARPVLRSDTLASDVRRVVRASPAAAPDAEKDAAGSACEPPVAPRGADVVDVLLDGDPATLVVERAAGGTREARVYSCADGTAVLRTTSVPTR